MAVLIPFLLLSIWPATTMKVTNRPFVLIHFIFCYNTGFYFDLARHDACGILHGGFLFETHAHVIHIGVGGIIVTGLRITAYFSSRE